jgi:hypothetical protein
MARPPRKAQDDLLGNTLCFSSAIKKGEAQTQALIISPWLTESIESCNEWLKKMISLTRTVLVFLRSLQYVVDRFDAT